MVNSSTVLKVSDIFKTEIKKVKAIELGIDLPALTVIGLDGCPGEGSHTYEVRRFGFTVLGHAHCCPKDPDLGMICTNQRWLFNKDGSYSEILLHETAHILMDYSASLKCVGKTYEAHEWQTDFKTIDEVSEHIIHGPEWQKIAKELGAPPKRWATVPVV